MRRIVSLLLLLLAVVPCASQGALCQSTTPDAEQLRATAHALLRSGAPEDTARAADLLQKASAIDLQTAETRRNEAERLNMERPSRTSWTTLATVLTPVLTTLILAGTLLFNIYQSRISEQEKLADNRRQDDKDEKKRFDDALELIQKATNASPVAALINSFPVEPYRSGVRAMGRTALLSSRSFPEFRDLFNTIFPRIAAADFPGALDLLRSIHSTVGPLLSKTWIGNTNDLSKLTPEEIGQYNLLVAERTFVGEKVATFLREPRNPAAPPLDLTSAGFDGSSFSGADLRNARISNTTWNLVDFDGCNLGGITDFQNCWLYNTAWWHASQIDRDLLDFLKTNCAFYVGEVVNSRVPVSAEEYAASVSRLEATAH